MCGGEFGGAGVGWVGVGVGEWTRIGRIKTDFVRRLFGEGFRAQGMGGYYSGLRKERMGGAVLVREVLGREG